ncbi:SPOR domain-containing protein [uncultured Thiohalocapsa sp.]|uniref:SPOR domain-containing protein n=1 Tax=uncultured Thiohalocapsa sp. TaxID=768990 RepID=UPI0025F929E4|nr:SPOR domain-containing protein [uncultured Thiohalocapsa sp.]
MTLDYRKGTPPPRRHKKPRGTCAFWFLAGGLVGAFGVGAAWLYHEPVDTGEPTAAAVPPTERPLERKPPPRFDFYDMLPKQEIVVPAEREPEPVPLPPQQPPVAPEQLPVTPSQQPTAAPAQPDPAPAQTAGTGDFMLQVGSFRRSNDAERLKAQLALIGIQTSIQTVTIDSGQTYHRVRTGAYAKGDANAVRAKLQENGHKPMMMRAQ